MLALALLLLPFVTMSQVLTYQEAHIDNLNGIDGLEGGYGVAVSPDSLHVYAVGSADKAVVLFDRDSATGNLTYVTAYFDTSAAGTIPGLNGPRRLKLSRDGLHLYVPCSNSDAIVVFGRNLTDGTLTHVQTLTEGVAGTIGINGTEDLEVTQDGNFLYAIGGSSDALCTFSRNTSTGMLTQLQVISDTTAGIDGLNSASGMALSPDQKTIYVSAQIDDAISVFSRDVNTGMVTFEEVWLNGVFGVDGLNSAYDVDVSPDNMHVYSISSVDDAICLFERDTTTGHLTYVTTYWDDSQGGNVPLLNGGRCVKVGPNGDFVFSAASIDDGLTVFARNTTTGALTVIEQYEDNLFGVEGLDGIRYMAIAPNGKNLYTSSATDDAVSVFGGPVGGSASVTTSTTINICAGDSAFAGGAWQQTAGTYIDTLTAQSGVDSILTTTLTVQTPPTTTENLTICGTDSVFIGGGWQTISGTYYDTLSTTLGCDSIIASVLSVSGQVIDTVTIMDTLQITTYDTTAITVFDTVQVFIDTVVVNVYDTIPVCDSIVVVLDTMPVFDTIPVCDTLVFDTSVVTVYDTLIVFEYDTVPYYLDSIAVTDTLIIDVIIGIGPPPDSISMLVYPNPARTEVVFLALDPTWITGYKIRIVDALGQQVAQRTVNSQLIELNVDDVFGATGLYVIQIINPQGVKVTSKKLILQ